MPLTELADVYRRRHSERAVVYARCDQTLPTLFFHSATIASVGRFGQDLSERGAPSERGAEAVGGDCGDDRQRE